MRNILFSLLIIPLLVACGGKRKWEDASGEDSVKRGILLGTTSNANWVGAVIVNRQDGAGQNVCTGSLITPRHVLTAAHCFNGQVRPTSEYDDGVALRATTSQVVFSTAQNIYSIGSNSVRSTAVFFTSNRYIYTNARPETDIAIIKLERAYPGITQDQIPVWVSRDTRLAVYNGQNNLTAYGYGKSSDSSNSVGYRRMGAVIGLGSRAGAGYMNTYVDRLIFGVRRGGANQIGCGGDSGGPLVIPAMNGFRARIIGVLKSGNSSTCSAMTYNEYTNPATFGTWLDAVLSQ